MKTCRPLRVLAAITSLSAAFVLAGCNGCAPTRPSPNVVTQHNNAARWGQTLAETTLKPSNVKLGSFGMLYARNVNGGIFAQPLYVRGVEIDTVSNGRWSWRPRRKKNLFFIATETNWVYAFDADDTNPDPATGAVFQRQLQPTGPVAICSETASGVVGITSTPVIDTNSGTMYVVARNASNHQYYLHALDINGLNDKRAPVQIVATDPHGVQFNPECERNRPGLLLLNGVVYIGFGTLNCDAFCPNNVPYRGWVFGYRASDLAQVGVFCTSCSPPEISGDRGGRAGVWQSGNGLVGVGPPDTIYFETGNGFGQLGDCFVKLRVISSLPGLQLDASFCPSNKGALDDSDTDLGSGGPVWFEPGVLIGGGKQGRYYVLDGDTMKLTQDEGPTPPGNTDGFQAFFNTYHFDTTKPPCPPGCGGGLDCFLTESRYQNGEVCGPNIHAGPVYWSRANPNYGLLYQMAEKDYVKSFFYDRITRHLVEIPFRISTIRPVDGMPGGFSSLSANDDQNAILWTSIPLGNGQWHNVPGRLAAFDALTLQELWHDDGGYLFAKFTPPTIADGKVFRATFSNKVVVYGLLTSSWWQASFNYVFRRKFPPPPPERIEQEAIEEKYQLAGANRGVLGSPAGEARPVQDGPGGWYRDFRGFVIGSVSSTVSTKAAPGGEMPGCGDPPKPGAGTPVESSIYWSRKTGAHLVTAEIRQLWLKLGGPKSSLGYPISDEEPAIAGIGRMSRFEHGQILWSPNKGPSINPQTSSGTASPK